MLVYNLYKGLQSYTYIGCKYPWWFIACMTIHSPIRMATIVYFIFYTPKIMFCSDCLVKLFIIRISCLPKRWKRLSSWFNRRLFVKWRHNDSVDDVTVVSPIISRDWELDRVGSPRSKTIPIYGLKRTKHILLFIEEWQSFTLTTQKLDTSHITRN